MLSKLQNKREEGFTIIEVLIVLAIAGLIMLIVFLAVPALQRNQRNNGRNSDASRIAASMTECLSNRNGVIASCTDDANWNVGTLSQLATADASASGAVAAGTTTTITAGFGRICNATGDDDQAGSARDFVVIFQLEPTINRCVSS